MKDGYYVWFDTEYSDLDLKKAVLLQVAAFATDASLRRVLPPDRDVRLAIRLSNDAELSDWVRRHLPDLIDRCRSAEAVDVAEADDRLCAHVAAVAELAGVGEEFRPVLAGSSIHIDWWLAYRFLPRFLSRLHYRLLDVTTIKLEWTRLHPRSKGFDKEDPLLVRRHFPGAVCPVSTNRHDALYDAEASVAELAFYRKHLLRPGRFSRPVPG
jgi:oligoribonuclease